MLMLLYFIVISLVTAGVWRWDKRQSSLWWWRVSERFLLILVMMGGIIGALWWMEAMRHKTKKSSFLWKLRWIVLLQILLVVMIYRQVVNHKP